MPSDYNLLLHSVSGARQTVPRKNKNCESGGGGVTQPRPVLFTTNDEPL